MAFCRLVGSANHDNRHSYDGSGEHHCDEASSNPETAGERLEPARNHFGAFSITR
jgi:hypothetical protein